MRALLGLMCWAALATVTAVAAPYEYRLVPSATVVSPGGSITVDVYLRQNPGDGGTLLTAEGLLSGGVVLKQLSGAGSATVAGPAGITPNPAFDVVTTYPFDTPFPDPSGNPVAGFLAFATGPTGVKPPGASDELLLGSFAVTLQGPGPTVELGAFLPDPTPGFDSLVTFDTGTVLDPDTATALTSEGARATIRLTEPVPEPGSLLLLGLALAGLTTWGGKTSRGKG